VYTALKQTTNRQIKICFLGVFVIHTLTQAGRQAGRQVLAGRFIEISHKNSEENRAEEEIGLSQDSMDEGIMNEGCPGTIPGCASGRHSRLLN